ncbi:DUF2000 domain-containing protein [Candidatus Kaiserbacteria bacterium]|nr:DUF2000 domain-containing protein [Candidatus Kaiserbacteria bacterium]
MNQDFDNRIILVIRHDLAGWQTANTIAHISGYLGNRLERRFGTGDFFVTSDGVRHPRNSQYPIIIKRAKSNEQLHNLMEKIRTAEVLYHGFVREMIDFNGDADVQECFGKKLDAEVEYLGIGVFGLNDVVNALTKKFGLWE